MRRLPETPLNSTYRNVAVSERTMGKLELLSIASAKHLTCFGAIAEVPNQDPTIRF
jgi:hypothetical protein